MAAELVKGKFGSSSSKLSGVAAALLPSRSIAHARRNLTAHPALMIQSQVLQLFLMTLGLI